MSSRVTLPNYTRAEWARFSKKDLIKFLGHKEVAIGRLFQSINRLDAELCKSRKFVEHIQAHLAPGEKVICKICGKTAKEICK